MARFREVYEEWLNKRYRPALRNGERKKFVTPSGIPLKPIYTHLDVPDPSALGLPGEYPYTRGVYPTMYRGRLWTKRLLAGYGDPHAFNERVKMLLEAGETGINVPAPSVSMRGYDTDRFAEEFDPGYIGLYGTPVDTVEDLEICFAGVPIEEISVNYSDPGPFVSIAMHFAMARRRGLSLSDIRGTSNQADCLSHWVNCHQFVLFPLEVHMRLTVDHIEWCARNAPKWHPLSLIGQHASQSGATPAQELAFTLAAGICYVEECIKAGLNVDDFAPRVGAFFDGQIYLFELVAKLRAARRMWARIMKERFGARDPRSLQLPIHVQTSGVELTRQQPLLNIARVAIQALGAVLGGVQSLHTDSYDEAITTPTKEAALIALMTQHVISDETGVADVIDPLGGSYFVEALTDAIEQKAWEYIERIDSMGGMLEAVKSGFIYQEITNSIRNELQAMEKKEKVVVGVNEYVVPEEEASFETTKPDPEAIARQMERTRRIRRERNQLAAREALAKLKATAEGAHKGSIFECVLEAADKDCTRGEIVGVLKEVFGTGRPEFGI